MDAESWENYRLQLEVRYLSDREHLIIGFHIIPDLINAVYSANSRQEIKSVSSFLPFDHQLPNNIYALQGGGDYYILEADFIEKEKLLVQVLHINQHNGQLPRTQKYGNIIDAMIRLRYMANQPQFAGATTYLVVITDAILINYLDGIVFEDKLITEAWINNQQQSFQNAILSTCRAYINAGHQVQATVMHPLFQPGGPGGENFGTCIWQIE